MPHPARLAAALAVFVFGSACSAGRNGGVSDPPPPPSLVTATPLPPGSTPGVTAFAQTVPADPGTIEVFPAGKAK